LSRSAHELAVFGGTILHAILASLATNKARIIALPSAALFGLVLFLFWGSIDAAVQDRWNVTPGKFALYFANCKILSRDAADCAQTRSRIAGDFVDSKDKEQDTRFDELERQLASVIKQQEQSNDQIAQLSLRTIELAQQLALASEAGDNARVAELTESIAEVGAELELANLNAADIQTSIAALSSSLSGALRSDARVLSFEVSPEVGTLAPNLVAPDSSVASREKPFVEAFIDGPKSRGSSSHLMSPEVESYIQPNGTWTLPPSSPRSVVVTSTSAIGSGVQTEFVDADVEEIISNVFEKVGLEPRADEFSKAIPELAPLPNPEGAFAMMQGQLAPPVFEVPKAPSIVSPSPSDLAGLDVQQTISYAFERVDQDALATRLEPWVPDTFPDPSFDTARFIDRVDSPKPTQPWDKNWDFKANPRLTAETQLVLKSLGYDPGVIDGRWGPNTQAAWDKAQSELGLSTTKYPTEFVIHDLRGRIPAIDAGQVDGFIAANHSRVSRHSRPDLLGADAGYGTARDTYATQSRVGGTNSSQIASHENGIQMPNNWSSISTTTMNCTNCTDMTGTIGSYEQSDIIGTRSIEHSYEPYSYENNMVLGNSGFGQSDLIVRHQDFMNSFQSPTIDIPSFSVPSVSIPSFSMD
jgi:hypothetical protein